MSGFGHKYEAMSDINVTPFVDVMLVLLIIFMVAAPMLNQGEELNLPEIDSSPVAEKEEPLIISIDKKGDIWVQDVQVARPFLDKHIKDWLEKSSDPQVLLKADGDLAYGSVLELVHLIRKAGVAQLAMLTQPLTASGKRDEVSGK